MEGLGRLVSRTDVWCTARLPGSKSNTTSLALSPGVGNDQKEPVPAHRKVPDRSPCHLLASPLVPVWWGLAFLLSTCLVGDRSLFPSTCLVGSGCLSTCLVGSAFFGTFCAVWLYTLLLPNNPCDGGWPAGEGGGGAVQIVFLRLLIPMQRAE